MADPNMVDFYGRIARIEKARSKGYGFEASGTLGRSFYSLHHAPKKRGSILAPVLFVLLCAFGMKGMILHSVGLRSYESKVAALMSGEGLDRFGGWMMQADPVTILAADKIGDMVASLN